MALRFSSWYPLAPDAIEANAPEAAGVYEVRVYGPLLAYPKGRSAMVLYGATGDHAQTLRKALRVLSERGLPAAARSAVGSHQVYFRTAAAQRPHEELRRRLADFQMRFGAHPIGNA
jgi:hypothetical protein